MNKQQTPLFQSSSLPASYRLDEASNGLVIPLHSTKSIKLTLKGSVPSKKNQKQIVYVRGRPLILPSKAHEAWHKEALQSLQFDRIQQLKLQDIQIIICTIYPPTMRKYDLSNKFESVADLLVDYGLLEDDNADILSKVLIFNGGKDASNPRAEVVLYY